MSSRPTKTGAFIAAVLLYGLTGAVGITEAQTIAVPTGDGRPVMTDGLFHPEEWADAASHPLGETVELYLKEFRGHVYVGVHCGELDKPFSMDLYLAGSDGEIRQLHTSAQIGERALTPGEEDPPWIWGYSPDWYANEVRWNQPMAHSLMEEGETRTEAQRAALFDYDGFEFQILRDKFSGNEWLLRVEVRSYPDFDSPLIHPEGTPRDRADGWMRLVFNGG